MARKGWSSLSSDYRDRLERGGISRSDYESGASLAGARGHGTTPEKPLTSFENVPSQYQSYADLRREIVELKRSLLQDSGKREYASWEKHQLKELRGRSKAALEKARDILDARVNQQMSWEALVAMFPELEDDEWDWVGHYH